MATLFVTALAFSQHDDQPRLPELELATSEEESTAAAIARLFPLDHLDLECQMDITETPLAIVRPLPPPPGSEATATTSDPAATAPPPGVFLRERLRHDPQRSPQDVADNLAAYYLAKYPDRPVARLPIEVGEQHGDYAQLTGRFDGRLQFLALVKRWPDGTWDGLYRMNCDDLWVTS